METVRFRISSLSLEIQVERNAKSFKKRNSVFHARVTVQSSNTSYSMVEHIIRSVILRVA